MEQIEVILRMCPDRSTSLSGDKSRPQNFSKELVFKNLYETKDDATNITVLFDGDHTGHWIKKYPVRVIQSIGGNGDESFKSQIMYIKFANFSDNTIVYILEDDYLHRDGWPQILREGFGNLQPSFLKFDYITLYDHRDKYTYPMYNALVSKIGISDTIHWRTVPSTTNTFAMKYKTFIEDFDIHYSFLNSDHEKFLELGRNKRLLGSCMPGYSTHCHKDYMSPCIDWP